MHVSAPPRATIKIRRSGEWRLQLDWCVTQLAKTFLSSFYSLCSCLSRVSHSYSLLDSICVSIVSQCGLCKMYICREQQAHRMRGREREKKKAYLTLRPTWLCQSGWLCGLPVASRNKSWEKKKKKQRRWRHETHKAVAHTVALVASLSQGAKKIASSSCSSSSSSSSSPLHSSPK